MTPNPHGLGALGRGRGDDRVRRGETVVQPAALGVAEVRSQGHDSGPVDRDGLGRDRSDCDRRAVALGYRHAQALRRFEPAGITRGHADDCGSVVNTGEGQGAPRHRRRGHRGVRGHGLVRQNVPVRIAEERGHINGGRLAHGHCPGGDGPDRHRRPVEHRHLEALGKRTGLRGRERRPSQSRSPLPLP